MKRIFDIILSIVVGYVLTITTLLISLFIYLTSLGPILYWSNRVGKDNSVFRMPKFRSMHVGVPTSATHF